MIQTVKFDIDTISGEYRQESAIAGAPHPIRWNGVAHMDVECHGCGYRWTSYSGQTHKPLAAGIIVDCPNCGASELLEMAALRDASS